MAHKLIAPLRVLKTSSKYAPINLNTYRNIHYYLNNTMKRNYKAAMQEQIIKLPTFSKIAVLYTLYPKDKRLCDLGNMLCIQSKFFLDALVEFKKLPDDNYLYVSEEVHKIGYVDKAHPRVEIEIIDLTKNGEH